MPLPADKVFFENTSFSFQEIFNFVDCFYRKVASDDLLKEPFASVRDWKSHIQHMTHFWWIRFGGEPYLNTRYSPIPKHFYSGFNRERLSRWISLFDEALINIELTSLQRSAWLGLARRIGDFLDHRNTSLMQLQSEQALVELASSVYGMPKLPKGFESYKKTPLMTTSTVPRGLLQNHRTKKNIWGVIRVLKGRLEYTIQSSEPVIIQLSPSLPGIIEAEKLHRVRPLGDVEFYVEFFRESVS